MSRKVAMIGECMIELSQKSADVRCGSSSGTLSTSVYIARQVDAAVLPVHYVTTLGAGSLNQQMPESWQDENVDTPLTQRMESRLPGLYYVETDNTGERTFYYWRDEAAAEFWPGSEQSAAVYEELATLDYLYLSGISLMILSPASYDKLLSLLRKCHTSGGEVILGNNCHPRLWGSKEETQQVYRQMLECTNIAFLTLDDEDALWGEESVAEIIARTHTAGVQGVVVRRGTDSCLVSIAGGKLINIPAVKLPKEEVIDTTATGDFFSAGYLAVRPTGGNAAEVARRGHLTASTVIQHRGAIIPRDAMPQ